MQQLQKPINHVVLVLDASGSMNALVPTVVKVVDNQIAHLAQRSKELDQETRVSVYKFSGHREIENLIYDQDVLRLPSIKDHYRATNMTAMRDATQQSITDLEKTATLYGDHAFLLFVFTDGADNDSRVVSESALKHKIESLPENWTVAAFVPNHMGVASAKNAGFPAQNISVWDANSVTGVEKAGETVRQTTDAYMSARQTAYTSGTVFRGTKSVFSLTLDTSNVDRTTVKAQLQHLSSTKFKAHTIKDTDPLQIESFVTKKHGNFVRGTAYYELTKPETIQAAKSICVRDVTTGKVYTGVAARDLIGLPHGDNARVKPDKNPNFQIFVQSTSNNRKLVPGTKLLVML